jgi:type II secretory pathway pseudopilin PulG
MKSLKLHYDNLQFGLLLRQKKCFRDFVVGKPGYTFIELLVSVAVIIVVGSLIFSVFVSVLKGTDTSQAAIVKRQNGMYALNQIVKTIRQAETIVNFDACATPSGAKDLVLTSTRDSFPTTLSCSSTNITLENSQEKAFLLDDTEVHPGNSCSFSCGMQAPSDIPYVTVAFTLHRSASQSAVAEDTGLDFKTTVLLRNTIQAE